MPTIAKSKKETWKGALAKMQLLYRDKLKEVINSSYGPAVITDIPGVGYNGLMFVSSKTGKVEIADIKHEILHYHLDNPPYFDIHRMDKNKPGNENMGILSTQGRVLIPPNYSNIEQYGNNIYLAYKKPILYNTINDLDIYRGNRLIASTKNCRFYSVFSGTYPNDGIMPFLVIYPSKNPGKHCVVGYFIFRHTVLRLQMCRLEVGFAAEAHKTIHEFTYKIPDVDTEFKLDRDILREVFKNQSLALKMGFKEI